jgi:hypothetical protein
VTDEELMAEVEGFLAQGGRGEFEDMGGLHLTFFTFNRPMLALSASDNAGYVRFHCEVENTFGRLAATNWSIGPISASPSATSSLRESAAHTS